MFRYFTIGTAWERSAFAGKIAKRAGAAENLAMGAFLRRDSEQIKQDRDRLYELFPILFQRRHQYALRRRHPLAVLG